MSENSGESNGKSIGVRFAESAIGEPIVAALLFVTGSFWLSFATVGALVLLTSLFMGETVMAGITAVFGLSGLFVGLLGYAVYILYDRSRDPHA